MKIMAAMAMMAAIGDSWAKRIPDASSPLVTVCINTLVAASSLIPISRSQSEASNIFAEVPLRIAWSRGKPCQAADIIHIRVSDQTPERLRPGALAYALPYEGDHIEVFFDRILNAVPPSTAPHLLAHVLVHEITHILQGAARHSDTGIMKAHWTPDDFRQMSRQSMHFAPEDVGLIRAGLRGRSEQLRALTPAAMPPESR
jgi:hypothetical protein